MENLKSASHALSKWRVESVPPRAHCNRPWLRPTAGWNATAWPYSRHCPTQCSSRRTGCSRSGPNTWPHCHGRRSLAGLGLENGKKFRFFFDLGFYYSWNLLPFSLMFTCLSMYFFSSGGWVLLIVAVCRVEDFFRNIKELSYLWKCKIINFKCFLHFSI